MQKEANRVGDPFEPWSINSEDFPHGGSHTDKLKFLLGYAVLAPSSHNTQPWLFRIRDSFVELYADRARGLRIADPDDREMTISCGAALFSLATAMRHFGYLGGVDILPDPGDPDLLARVHLGLQSERSVADTMLFHSIPKRRTNRQEFRDDPLPSPLIATLEASAGIEGAWLRTIQDDERRYELADLISEADRQQWSNKRFRLEIAAWAHPNRSSVPDGIPGYSMGFEDLLSHAGPLLIRTFDMGEGQAARDRGIATGSPCLGILGTPEDNVRSWLDAGQALMRISLRARVEDVWISFLNQPVEIPLLRNKLGAISGERGFPQLVLRLGFAEDIRPTPRRAVAQLLI